MLLFLLSLVKRRRNIKGAFSHAREHPLCAADSDKHTDPVRQYGDDAARDGDAEEDDRHGTLQAHIEHGGDERARPRAGARQRNGCLLYTSIKDFDAGEPISYGRTYFTQRHSRIAVLPIGYADGLHRALSNQIEVLTPYGRAKQVGRICMDMCMIDVTDLPQVKSGDEVEILSLIHI